MGLPSSLDGVDDPARSDAARNEKLLRTELEGVERGDALALRGVSTRHEAARGRASFEESSSKGSIPKRVGRSPANLVISGVEGCPM